MLCFLVGWLAADWAEAHHLLPPAPLWSTRCRVTCELSAGLHISVVNLLNVFWKRFTCPFR